MLQFPIFIAWIYIFITVRKISDKQKIINLLKNDLDRFAVDRHLKLDKILSASGHWCPPLQRLVIQNLDEQKILGLKNFKNSSSPAAAPHRQPRQTATIIERPKPLFTDILKQKPIKNYTAFLQSNSYNTNTKIEQHQKIRQNRLKLACEKFPENVNLEQELANPLVHLDLKNEPRMYYSKTANIMYCSLTKCGSTNWKKTIRDIERFRSGVVPKEAFIGEKAVFQSHKDTMNKIRRRRRESSGQISNKNLFAHPKFQKLIDFSKGRWGDYRGVLNLGDNFRLGPTDFLNSANFLEKAKYVFLNRTSKIQTSTETDNFHVFGPISKKNCPY